MAKNTEYTITNNRKGPYTVLRAGVKPVQIPAGGSVTLELTAAELKNAEFEDVDVSEVKAAAPKGGKGEGE